MLRPGTRNAGPRGPHVTICTVASAIVQLRGGRAGLVVNDPPLLSCIGRAKNGQEAGRAHRADEVVPVGVGA